MVAARTIPNNDDDDLVPLADACPICGERQQDRLVWIDDERVRCANCKAEYSPPARTADQ